MQTAAPPAPASGGTSADETPLVQPAPDASGNATYTDPAYHFSLTYPAAYKLGKLSSDDGDTFLIQNDAGVGMQLVVSPFDESEATLTEARIKQDLPDMPMSDVRQVTLPKANIPAVAFGSSGGGFGQSIEVWFVSGGNLYQASTYAAGADFLQSVMGTFALSH